MKEPSEEEPELATLDRAWVAHGDDFSRFFSGAEMKSRIEMARIARDLLIERSCQRTDQTEDHFRRMFFLVCPELEDSKLERTTTLLPQFIKIRVEVCSKFLI